VNHVPQTASRADYFSSLLAETDVVADFEAQGVTVTPRVSISDGNVRCVSDCVITGAPGQQLEVPSGFVAEDTSGTKLAGNNGGPLTKITLNSEGRAIIEVKTGGASLTGNQSVGYPAAQSGTAAGVGGNASRARLSGSFSATPVYVLRR
jgi:filamentous hemagglutinin